MLNAPKLSIHHLIIVNKLLLIFNQNIARMDEFQCWLELTPDVSAYFGVNKSIILVVSS